MNPNMIIETLHKMAVAERSQASSNLNVYLSSPVGVGEHGKVVEEIYKLVGDVATADGKVEVIEKMISKINEEIAKSEKSS